MATLRDDDGDQDQVDEGTVELEQEETPKEPDTKVVDASEEQDTRLNADEEDDDRTDSGDEDDSADGRKRKESARDRRIRAKAAKARDKEELQLLRATIAKQDQRLNQTERALTETQFNDLNGRLATAQSYIKQWDEVDIKATKAGNVSDATTARQYRDQAQNEARVLTQHVEALKQKLSSPVSTPQANPRVAQLATQFISDKPWYNPKSGDRDSLLLEALDRSLGSTMDASQPGYWEELGKQAKKLLPHKFKAQADDGDDDDMEDDTPVRESTPAPRRKGPPTGGSSRTNSSGKVTEIRLPAQMVEAMKEAGQWDDPVKRASVAKRYIAGLKNSRSNG